MRLGDGLLSKRSELEFSWGWIEHRPQGSLRAEMGCVRVRAATFGGADVALHAVRKEAKNPVARANTWRSEGG